MFNYFIIFIIIYLGSSFFTPYRVLADNSLIDTVLQAEDSIVTVKSLRTEIMPSAHASAAVDPSLSRIVVARTMKTGQLEKTGAGVIISSDGLIVTNLHTILGAQKIAVILHDQTILRAKILHTMPEHDLALLKITTPSPLKPIEFVDSNTVQLGDEVINIGHSVLLRDTISGGVITGLGTSSPDDHPELKTVELIRVNINLYKGDSGGPLLDKQGRLIGMIEAKQISKDKTTFAIPSNKIKKLYLDFIK